MLHFGDNAVKELAGTLKMRDMKQRERKLRHQNSLVETAGNGNNGNVAVGGKCET